MSEFPQTIPKESSGNIVGNQDVTELLKLESGKPPQLWRRVWIMMA